MTRTINILTLLAIAIWTLLSLGVWAIVSVGGDLIHSQLDWLFGGDPNVVPAMSSLLRFLQGLGLGLLAVIWALGTASLWFAGFVVRRFAQAVTAAPEGSIRWSDFQRSEPPESMMKDVTPPREAPPPTALPRPQDRPYPR